jgi:hypothetical protein
MGEAVEHYKNLPPAFITPLEAANMGFATVARPEYPMAADRAIAELEAERDAIFHEFTEDLRGDDWDVVLEWLQADYPHLYELYKDS